ncbi:unnamed protein product, partial [Mesorhabditis spiculigera]
LRPSRSSVSSGSASTDPHTDILVPSSDKEDGAGMKIHRKSPRRIYMLRLQEGLRTVQFCLLPCDNLPPYIHFHKYYRHHIPLPDTIDLGSRKCPFCRHVSKSPAMLESLARHVPGDRTTNDYPAIGPYGRLPVVNVSLSTGAFSIPQSTINPSRYTVRSAISRGVLYFS